MSLAPGDMRNGVRVKFRGEDAVGEGVIKVGLTLCVGSDSCFSHKHNGRRHATYTHVSGGGLFMQYVYRLI